MIKFDPNKEKNLKFRIEVQGIDPKLLEYNLRLSNGNIDYGFKGINENGEIIFNLPPLNEVLKFEMIESLDKIKLEVNDKNNKYYLKPYEDDIKIEKQLKVEAKLSEEIDNKNIPDVSVILDENEDKEKIVKKEKSKKSTKFGSFLGEK